MTLGFPTDPSELDAAWFTEALRSTGTIGDGVEVVSFEAEPIGIGAAWRPVGTGRNGAGAAQAIERRGKIVRAPDAPHDLAQDQHDPRLPDEVDGAAERAVRGVGVEVVHASHDSWV